MAARKITTPLVAVPAPSSDAYREPGKDRADRKLTQLRSLLKCMYGLGAEWFEEIGPDHRENVLWLASDLADEVAEAVEGEKANG